MQAHRTRISKRRQAGTSLIELILYVGAAVLIIIAILGVAYMVRSKAFAMNESRELPQVISGVQNTYNSQPNFAGATLDAVARGNVWPANETIIPGAGAATVSNRWGGAVTLTPGTITTGSDIARLVYSNVPQTECNNVVSAVAGSLRRVYVDNTNSGTAGAGTIVKADGGTLNVGTLATACSGAQNSITYDVPH
jgi:hypothetical protein